MGSRLCMQGTLLQPRRRADTLQTYSLRRRLRLSRARRWILSALRWTAPRWRSTPSSQPGACPAPSPATQTAGASPTAVAAATRRRQRRRRQGAAAAQRRRRRRARERRRDFLRCSFAAASLLVIERIALFDVLSRDLHPPCPATPCFVCFCAFRSRSTAEMLTKPARPQKEEVRGLPCKVKPTKQAALKSPVGHKKGLGKCYTSTSSFFCRVTGSIAIVLRLEQADGKGRDCQAAS